MDELPIEQRVRHITPWGYLGYSLLFSIPIVGFIFALVFGFSKKYKCRRNFARYYLLCILLAILIGVILGVICYATGFNYVEWLEKMNTTYQDYLHNLPRL